MLSVILKIFSILGIILLVLLAIIMILLLLVLFMPIVYRIKASRIRKDEDFETNAQVTARWMFGLVRVQYKYPDPGALKVKVLFFTVYDSSEEKDDESPEDNIPEDTAESVKTSSLPKSDSENASQNDADSVKPSIENKTEGVLEGEDANTILQAPKGIVSKIKCKIRDAYDKIKSIIDKIKDIYKDFTYYKEVLTCDDTKELLKQVCVRLGKILKKLRPRKLQADITVGTGSPDTTGYLYAVYGMLCSYLGKHVIVTPDFQQAIIEGKLYAAGFTTVFNILWNAFLIIKDKRLWELKDKLERNRSKSK